MSTEEDDGADECQGCGSTLSDRQEYVNRSENRDCHLSTSLFSCTFCDARKCCMCDLGSDVGCNNCPDHEDEDGDFD